MSESSINCANEDWQYTTTPDFLPAAFLNGEDITPEQCQEAAKLMVNEGRQNLLYGPDDFWKHIWNERKLHSKFQSTQTPFDYEEVKVVIFLVWERVRKEIMNCLERKNIMVFDLKKVWDQKEVSHYMVGGWLWQCKIRAYHPMKESMKTSRFFLQHKNIFPETVIRSIDRKIVTLRPFLHHPKTLHELMGYNENALNIEQRLGVFEDTLRGIKKAHDEGITHGDIKPANILVEEGIEGKVTGKLFDWEFYSRQPQDSVAGTNGFADFEYYQYQRDYENENREPAFDIFSLAITFLRMLNKYPPERGCFSPPGQEAMENREKEQKLHKFIEENFQGCPKVISLLQKMLFYERSKRPGIDEILKAFPDIKNEILLWQENNSRKK